MSALLNPDQPPPAASEGDVWREVIDWMGSRDVCGPAVLAWMEERRRLGIERYGQPLQRGDGRDHLIDARQELLDAVVYLWACDRRDEARDVVAVLRRLA